MARRSKRRGFAGTAKEHRKHSAAWARNLRLHASEVKRYLNRGECSLAFDRLIPYVRTWARYATERAWGRTGTKGRGLTRPGSALVHRFERQCIIGKVR